MRVLALLLAACGAQSVDETPSNRAPSAMAGSAVPACPVDGTARLSIVTGPLPKGCEGGRYLIDGVEMGSYPITCAKVPAGLHTVGIHSANDCAGYLRGCKRDFVIDRITVLDVRAPTCLR